MEMRRTWVDLMSRRSHSDGSAIQDWVRGALLERYSDVLREELPRELLDLLPEE